MDTYRQTNFLYYGIWYTKKNLPRNTIQTNFWKLNFQILGFDSLEIIPLLAIVILSFRKESLMQVETLENIEAVLADLSSIKILPLLQLALTANRD